MISNFQACIIRRKMTKTQKTNNTIAQNRKARHDFFIEEHYEAGVALQGWEVKSLREGRVPELPAPLPPAAGIRIRTTTRAPPPAPAPPPHPKPILSSITDQGGGIIPRPKG
jgi:hypothetical protein